MAFRRATKSGQVIRIPLLSDPDYRARRLSRLEEAQAEEKLFFESLDASVLKTDLTDVTHVMIRGLTGKDFADAQAAAYSALRGEVYSDTAFGSAQILEIIKRGLLGIDGDDPGCPAPALYPLEHLYGDGGYGEHWPLVMYELHERIKVWSSLGEASGSPSAPWFGEPG